MRIGMESARLVCVALAVSLSAGAVSAADGLWTTRDGWQRVNVSSGRPVITPFKPGDDIFQSIDDFAERPLAFLTPDEILTGAPDRLTYIDADKLIVREDDRSITFKVPAVEKEGTLLATNFYENINIAGIEVSPGRMNGFLLFRTSRPQPPIFSKGAECLAFKGVEYSKPVFVIDLARTIPADYVTQYLAENARAGYEHAVPEAGTWMGSKWERAPEIALERDRYGGSVWYGGKIYDAHPIDRGRKGERRLCRVFNSTAVADIAAYYARPKK